MANLKEFVYLSNEAFETLVSTGTVTVRGDVLTYDPDHNVYVTPDNFHAVAYSGDYTDLINKPVFENKSADIGTSLTTIATIGGVNIQSKITHQSIKSIAISSSGQTVPGSAESVAGSGSITLHKIAKTGLFSDLLSKPTTISGYGITDAKIESGTITLGSSTITPLTSHQSVTDKSATLSWNSLVTVATIGSTDVKVKLPVDPTTDLVKIKSIGDNLDLSQQGELSAVIPTTYVESITASGNDLTITPHSGTSFTFSNTTYSAATASALGLIKVGAVRNSAITSTTGGTTSGRYYGVELDSNNKAFVNVPWENTNTDTQVNVTLATTSKAYLLGTTSTPTSTASATAAVADTGVYLDTTAGRLYATEFDEGGTLLSNKYAAKTHSHSQYLTAHPSITTETDTTDSGTLSHSGTFTAITSVTRDSNGHVTKINTKTYTLPSDNNTDTKVTQGYSNDNGSYPILMSATAGITSTSTRGDITSIVNNGIYANPSTGSLYATKLYSGGTEVSVAGHTHSYSADTHVHGYITNDGKVTTAESTASNISKFLITTSDGTVKAATAVNALTAIGAAASGHNHDSAYDSIGSAASALTSANSYTDEKIGALGTVINFQGTKSSEAEIKAITSAAKGDMWINSANGSQWLCIQAINGTASASSWEEIGNSAGTVIDPNYKHITVTSSSVSDGTNTFNKYSHPTYDEATATAKKIGRDATGHVVIGGNITASDVGAATSGHTHNLSLAATEDTTSISLAANTKYKLTAGGSTYVFTTPADTNTHNSHSVISGKKSDGSTDIKGTASSSDITLGDSGVTANAYGDSSAQTPGYGSTFKVPYIRVNAKGIVTEISEHTVTIPASDNTNTASAVDNILDGSNSGTAITYAPYSTQQNKLSFDTSETAPARTDRLNLNGYLYATKLYSGGTEVSVAGHTHNYAASGHTHNISLATDTGTADIDLSHGGKYKLTAGGKSVVFTLPADNNTNYYHSPVMNSGLKIATGSGVNDMYVQDASTTQKGVTQFTATNLNTWINQLSSGDSDPQDADYYIAQYAGGGTSTTTYHRRPVSKLYNYIKTKLSISSSNNTASWGSAVVVGSVGGTELKFTMPSNPNTNTAHTHAAGTGLTLADENTGGTSGIVTYKAKLNSETSLGTIGTTSKLYAVGVDSNGKLCVNVPWTDNDTTSFNFSQINNRGEAWLEWGGRATSGQLTPVGMAISSEHSPNRLAFINGDSLTFEYSSDGSTWNNYSYSASQKSEFCTKSLMVPVGRPDNTTDLTTTMKTRITLTAQDGTHQYVYTSAKKLFIRMSTAQSMNVIVESRTGTNYESDGAWEQRGSYTVNGWSGWNDIPLGFSVGGGSSQKSNNWQLRLTFTPLSVSSTYPKEGYVMAIRMFGDNDWYTTSRMASINHLYDFDMSQNATFPANVYAVQFRENGSFLVNKYQAKFADQAANKVYAGPASGSNAAPGFRSLVKADLPSLGASDVGITVTSSSVSDGTNTFNKFTHATYEEQSAGLFKIGRDSTGHVVIGDAFTIPTGFTITATDDILDGTNGTNSVKYAPYSSQQSKLSFDISSSNPSRSGSGNRLNLNGDFYATNLYGINGSSEAKKAILEGDSRLSDARTPTSHTHGNINNGGTITSTAVSSATGFLVYDSSNAIQRATNANALTIIGAASSGHSHGNITNAGKVTTTESTVSNISHILITKTDGTVERATPANIIAALQATNLLTISGTTTLFSITIGSRSITFSQNSNGDGLQVSYSDEFSS